ncbi:hypothetical protein Y032_0028g1750 [Ancylostoma ceylanicum]|uniref:Uncharacterized protein n=1 Tax=Ancylostoma ceylanicum TaxID=53326 RepID=A0A016US31_9BILA|nr:hypothetical protein Y032_0028g1750 [Ancylostoma ceylanicum]
MRFSYILPLNGVPVPMTKRKGASGRGCKALSGGPFDSIYGRVYNQGMSKCGAALNILCILSSQPAILWPLCKMGCLRRNFVSYDLQNRVGT